jgi:hypothetical protein
VITLSEIMPLLLTSFIIGASLGRIDKENLLFSSNYKIKLKLEEDPGTF